ncbi:MAG: hypothetical protein IJ720_00740 [Clostridia bacterium]|nr:hypothetical protein [Clostridia bacterium]MBQ8469995.1 hypothetical protein [Clostridia bacterium]MBR1703872.1 hypothetical protein [Clostridia bacterium]
MKQHIAHITALVLLLTMLLALTGCGDKKDTASDTGAGAKATTQVTGVNDILANGGTQSTTHVPSEEERAKAAKAAKNTAEGVDVDLTKLSGVMVYSQVFDMVSNPASYKGKTIRMEGNYGEYLDDETGNLYRACVIPDATACCEQGIEFVLKDDSNADEDLVEGLPCAVQGTFDTYYEGQVQYCTLRNAVLV